MFCTRRQHQKPTSAPSQSQQRAHILQYTRSPSALKAKWSARGCCQWARPERQNFTKGPNGIRWYPSTSRLTKALLGFVWSVFLAFVLDLLEVSSWGTEELAAKCLWGKQISKKWLARAHMYNRCGWTDGWLFWMSGRTHASMSMLACTNVNMCENECIWTAPKYIHDSTCSHFKMCMKANTEIQRLPRHEDG